MKAAMSALDLHFIIQEMQCLMDSKLDRFYQPEKKELLLQFHKTGSGKSMLKIILGEILFLTDYKKENPEMNHAFCVQARKLLLGARLRKIEQAGFERIVELSLESKESKYKLILELFSKGNAIVTDEKDIILICLENQAWKDRVIKSKEKYIRPTKESIFFELTENSLKNVMDASKRQNIVKILAIDLGLGGIYAEELCIRAGIDKEKRQLTPAELKQLFKAVEVLKKEKIAPLIIKEESNGQEKVIDIIPFNLEFYEKFKKEKAESFNKALDENYTKKELLGIKGEKSEKKNKEIERAKETVRIQETQLAGLEQSAEENQRKGEIIYEKYKIVEDVLAQIKDARKKMSWKEIKEKLKDKKVIKKIDEEKGEITIDI